VQRTEQHAICLAQVGTAVASDAYHQWVSNDVARPRRIALRLCAATLAAGTLLGAPVNTRLAVADPCPDIEVLFARGTGDPMSGAPVGPAFVDSLRAKVAPRSVGVYGVNYAANMNFLLVTDGVNDAYNHVQFMIGNCPATRLVLAGFSQGAAVIDGVVGATPNVSAIPGVGAIPGMNDIPVVGAIPGLSAGAVLPPEAADHVAAVAVFGNPVDKLFGPLNGRSPAYGFKTIDLCNANDPICDGGDMDNRAAHHQYVPGATDQAAGFVAGLV
jgi:cutinase